MSVQHAWIAGVALGALCGALVGWIATYDVMRRRKGLGPLRLIRVTPRTMKTMQQVRVSGVPTHYCLREDGGYDLWPEPEPRQGEDE